MAITTTNITGDIALPDGTIPSKSSVTFVMTGFDTDASADTTIAPRSVTSVLSDTGALDVDLWSNEDGERTTFYNVRLNIYNGNSPKVFDVGKIEVPTTGGPYDLNDLLPIAPPSGATVDEYIAQLAASVASAEAAETGALASEVAAAASAAEAALYDGVWLDDVADLIADTALTYTASQPGTVVAGDIAQTRADGFSYEVAASGATDEHVETAGGVKLYVLPGANGFHVDAFGADGTVSGDTAAINAGLVAALSTGSTLVFSARRYLSSGSHLIHSACRLEGEPSFVGQWAEGEDVDSGTIIELQSSAGSVNVFEIKGTADSRITSEPDGFYLVEGVTVAGLEVRPEVDEEGGAAFFVDGSTVDDANRGSVRALRFENVNTARMGANGIHCKGNVFDVRFEGGYNRQSVGVQLFGESASIAVGGTINPRQFYCYGTRFKSYANDARSVIDFGVEGINDIQFYGGHLQGRGHGVELTAGSGLWGTHMEAENTDSGTIGARIVGRGVNFFPGEVNNLVTVLEIGDPSNDGAVIDSLNAGIMNANISSAHVDIASSTVVKVNGTGSSIRRGTVRKGFWDADFNSEVVDDTARGEVYLDGLQDADGVLRLQRRNKQNSVTPEDSDTQVVIGDTSVSKNMLEIAGNASGSVARFGVDNTTAIIECTRSDGSGHIDQMIGGTKYLQLFATDLRPFTDNTVDLGTAAKRWEEVFSANGTINTSDGREKEQVRDLSETELLVANRIKPLFRAFKWEDAVAAKGDGARWHFGVIAQDVIAAFEAEGLDPYRYGIVCYDEWPADEESGDPAGNRYGVRYSELTAFMLAASFI